MSDLTTDPMSFVCYNGHDDDSMTAEINEFAEGYRATVEIIGLHVGDGGWPLVKFTVTCDRDMYLLHMNYYQLL